MTSPQQPALRMGTYEWILLIFLSILWGASFFFGKIAVRELTPFTIALGRVLIAAAILATVVRTSGLAFPMGWRSWWPFFVMGFINNVVPFSLIFWGKKEIGSGLASVLNAATPLSGAIVAHFLTDDEKLHSNRLIGVVIGIAGVAILVGPASLGLDWGRALGAAAVLAATVSYGLAGVYGKRFRQVPALVTSCCQLTASSLMLTPLVLLVDQPWRHSLPGTTTFLAVLGLATLSTALAYVVFFTILRRAGASNALLVTLLVPFSATALGILVLGESLKPGDLLGAALVALALLVIDGRLFTKLRPAPNSASGRA
jgi:drug/metabolite transporter (DMT)-like permease